MTGPQVLVTGATGFLGAHLAHALLARGERVVVLARPAAGTPAAERFRRVLAWFGDDGVLASRATVLSGDLGEDRFGLPEPTWRALARSLGEIVHCAGSTSFTDGKRAELERTNVDGTARVLDLAAAGSTRAVRLVSTAYVAGAVEGDVDETWRTPAAFVNAYEETKHRAEALTRVRTAELGLPLTVFRPTIVYGDATTGRSLLFNALYYPVKMLLRLRSVFLDDLARDGARARAYGVEAAPDGGLVMPLRIESDPAGALDLVPVDFFTRACLALREAAPGGGTFHIASGVPTTTESIIGFMSRRYRIAGLTAADAPSFAARPRTPLENLFEGYLAVYRPYMLDRRRFVSEGCRETGRTAGVSCPPFTYEVFTRVMTYAEEVDWGKRLFEPRECLT